MVEKKKRIVKRPPQLTIFFPDDASLQKQIYTDAHVTGISVSALAKLALEVGYPIIRERLEDISKIKPVKKN